MRRFPFTTKDGRPGLVRAARPSDARACLAIVWEAVQQRPRTLLTSPEEFWKPRQWRRHRMDWGVNGVTLAAEVGGEVAASLGVRRGERPGERHACEFGIVVADRFRGIGVGRALLEAVETWAREQGVEKINLRVFSTNAGARALYERMGYEVEGIERRAAKFPDEYVDHVRMAKFLDSSAAEHPGT